MMDLEMIILSKVSKKEKYHMISLRYVWTLKYGTNASMKQTDAQI